MIRNPGDAKLTETLDTQFRGQWFNWYRGDDDVQPYLAEMGNPPADAGLPVLKTMPFDLAEVFGHSIKAVWDPATIVTVDEETKKFVMANGGNDYEVTYDSTDRMAGVRKLDGTIVAVGDKRVFKANKPIGMSFSIQLQNKACQPKLGNLVPEQGHAQVFLKGFVVLPIIYKTADSKYDFKLGDYIAADSPTAADILNNPNAKWGGVRVFVEEKDDTVAAGMIKRTSNLIVTGKQKDSIGQRVGRVIAAVDYSTVMKDRSVFNETYGSTKMVGPETAGYLPSYFHIWQLGFKDNPDMRNPYNKKIVNGEYKMKLLYIRLTDK